MPRDLISEFRESCKKYPDHTAIKYKKGDAWGDISYKTLGENINSLALFLSENSVRKTDKIAVLLKNRPEWPLIFFAALSIGAVVVPIYPESAPIEIENILRNSECETLFADNDSFLVKEDFRRKHPFIKNAISVDSDKFKEILKIPAARVNTQIDPSDLACILYTSGTTASPKGVMLTHLNLLSNCESLRRTNMLTHKDRVISVLPLHHVYPLVITMILPLLSGCTIINPAALRSETLLEAARESKATIFPAVPQIFHLFYSGILERFSKIPFPLNFAVRGLLELLYKIRKINGLNAARFLLGGIHKKFGNSLRFFVTGGARLDADVEKMLFKLGFTILEGYGLSETSPVLTISLPEKFKIGSPGLPLSDVDLKIEKPDKNGIGEVVVRGPNVMKGYYRRQDLTDAVIKNGWFHTGDLGYLDKQGYLFLTGRIKEVIVLSSGMNIYPEEIENIYSKHAPVKEMCVLEVPDKDPAKKNTVLWAVVVPDLELFKKFGEVHLKRVIKDRFDDTSRNLPAHKRLMGFFLTLEVLPRTLLGKIKRFAVRETYAQRIIKGEEYAGGPKELREEDLELLELASAKKIINYLKKQNKNKKHIDINDLLELDLGIDSLGRIELASGLEKLFNMQIEDKIIGDSFVVKDLILGIESLLKKEPRPLPPREQEISSGAAYWKHLLQIPPHAETLKRIDLAPGFLSRICTLIFTGLLGLVFKLFYDLRVEGKSNVPKKGPYMLYANHASFFDGPLVAVSLGTSLTLDVFFVGFRVYFDAPIIHDLMKIGRIIPLDFSEQLSEALRSSYFVLNNNKNLCLFPEGQRSIDGELVQFKKGFGILAKESDAKLVPVAIKGAYEAWPRTSKFPRRFAIKIKIGKPLSIESLEKKGLESGEKDPYEAISAAAREALLKLKETM